MTLGDYDQEFSRATAKMPFSNGFEGDCWMETWCEQCRHELTCPLLGIAMLGYTPAAWIEQAPFSLTERYRCTAQEPL